jgi:hypothetical protein
LELQVSSLPRAKAVDQHLPSRALTAQFVTARCSFTPGDVDLRVADIKDVSSSGFEPTIIQKFNVFVVSKTFHFWKVIFCLRNEELLCSVLLTNRHLGDEIKKTEMGRVCSTYEREERCIQGFGGET